MLLILEIMLTISAWRRGYKAWALLPVGLVLFIGFLIGYNDPEAVENGELMDFIWIDILAIVALVIMIFSAQSQEEEEFEELEDSKQEESSGQGELAASSAESGAK